MHRYYLRFTIFTVWLSSFGFKLSKNKENKEYNLINLNSYTCPESNVYGRFKESYSFGLACSKYIKDNRDNIDLIYMNSWPIFAQYLTVKEANKFGVPIITHIQDLYPESLSIKIPMLGFLFNLIFLPIDKIILKLSFYNHHITKSILNFFNTFLIYGYLLCYIFNYFVLSTNFRC